MELWTRCIRKSTTPFSVTQRCILDKENIALRDKERARTGPSEGLECNDTRRQSHKAYYLTYLTDRTSLGWLLDNVKIFQNGKPAERGSAFRFVIQFPVDGDKQLNKQANGKEIPDLPLWTENMSTFDGGPQFQDRIFSMVLG